MLYLNKFLNFFRDNFYYFCIKIKRPNLYIMKIKKLELVNFKRFSNLTIDLSASEELPKLVLLVGSNGSGKSSIFDAFELVSGYIKDRKRSNDKTITDSLDYYIKNDLINAFKVAIETNKGHFDFDTDNVRSHRDASIGYGFYGRSSLRQVPRLTRISLGSAKKNEINAIDTDRPRFYIERDERFENDIEIITGIILEEAFNTPHKTMGEIADKYILKINETFERVFGSNADTSLRLKTLIPPLNDNIANIRFEKGESVIHYNLLSSGEKEIFNIFINLISRQELYQDTIFFFDELDLHLNTALQKTLLKELTENWIPDNCQLWIASHSLGFIEYANEAPHAAIIDLDDRNFDTSISLTPQDKNDFDVFEIAVSKEFLDTIFLGRRVVFTEGTDTPFYNNLKIKNTFFFRAF